MKRKSNNEVVLAEGEVTGHAHRAVGDGVSLTDGLLTTPTEIEITHEEHNKIPLPAGQWEVGKVQEYDQFLEQARAVQD